MKQKVTNRFTLHFRMQALAAHLTDKQDTCRVFSFHLQKYTTLSTGIVPSKNECRFRSDWLDGYLARKLDLVTALGKLMDPLADKILVSSAFIYFSSVGRCPVWVTAVIIGREFLVTGLRQIAVEQGEVIAADRLGKWKTTFQLTFSITCMVSLISYLGDPQSSLGKFLMDLSAQGGWLSVISLWGAFVLTLLSGFNYLKKSWGLLLS